MKHRHRIPMVMVLSVFGLFTNIIAQPDLEKQVDELFAEWDHPNTPGAAVAVVKDGAVLYSKGYGKANLEYDIANSPSTVFHIASVSKQFTAFSALLLEADGKLSMDDDIRKYLPEVPDFGKKITLRHVATHTSGMRDQWNLLAMSGWRLDDVITKEHILKLVSHQKELNFDPGEEYVYCNTGFTLLAEVVARVSGKSFAEFTRERIFEPLQMNSTLFYDDHEKIVKNRAYSYYQDSATYKKSVLSYANVGATSLFTTVEDLARWTMNFKSTKVGNADIITQLNTLAVLNNGETFGGAMGQFVNTYKGLNQIQHGGADAGYRTYLGRFPGQDFAVIVFSNLASFNPGRKALQVADVYLNEYQIIAEASSASPANSPKYIKLKTKELKTFEANYWNAASEYSRKLYVKDDTLRYNRGGSESNLAPIAKNLFQMLDVAVDLKVKFEEWDGKQTMVVTIDDGDPIISEAYEPADYSNEQLEEYAGTYYSEELRTYYQFEVEAGRLVAKHKRLVDMHFDAIKDDLFLGGRWFFSKVEFHRDAAGDINGMKVSSGRVRNLRFEKR